MYRTIEGVYQNGGIELLEVPRDIHEQTRVIVTFLEDEQFDWTANGKKSEDPSMDSTQSIVGDLHSLLAEIRFHSNSDKCELFFTRFSRLISEHLWASVEQKSYEHRSLALLLERGIRRTSSTSLTYEQLDVFEFILNLLACPKISFEDKIECDKKLRAADIETLGIHSDEAVESLTNYIELLDRNEI